MKSLEELEKASTRDALFTYLGKWGTYGDESVRFHLETR